MSFKKSLIHFYKFENPQICFDVLTDSFCDEFKKKTNGDDDNDENEELYQIRADAEYDFVNEFIPFIHINDLYEELANRVKLGFEISIGPLHRFFTKHPQYQVWKKLAIAFDMSIPRINCYDFDVIAMPFWLEMINDLGYDAILQHKFPFKNTVLELTCKDMQTYKKYNEMRENKPFPKNKLKYFEWKNEH